MHARKWRHERLFVSSSPDGLQISDKKEIFKGTKRTVGYTWLSFRICIFVLEEGNGCILAFSIGRITNINSKFAHIFRKVTATYFQRYRFDRTIIDDLADTVSTMPSASSAEEQLLTANRDTKPRWSIIEKAERSHRRVPGLRKIPLPALAIIFVIALINILVWVAVGIVLVSVVCPSNNFYQH